VKGEAQAKIKSKKVKKDLEKAGFIVNVESVFGNHLKVWNGWVFALI